MLYKGFNRGGTGEEEEIGCSCQRMIFFWGGGRNLLGVTMVILRMTILSRLNKQMGASTALHLQLDADDEHTEAMRCIAAVKNRRDREAG